MLERMLRAIRYLKATPGSQRPGAGRESQRAGVA
jgi:hypothetical protein